MAVLPVLAYPDPRLRARCRPVGSITPEVERVIDDMIETMGASRAVGLAAPQIGVDLRIVTIDVSGSGDAPLVFIDPVIAGRRGLAMVEESCLSVPDVRTTVARAAEITVRSLSRTGETQERVAQDLLAVGLQHELDHLEGLLLVDRLWFPRRFFVERRLTSAARSSTEAAKS